MALLGLWRWLPPGQGLELAGRACQVLGALALLHTLIQGLRRPAPGYLPGWLVVGLTGVVLLGFGQTLIDPAAQARLQPLAMPLLALVGLLPALLLLLTGTALTTVTPVDREWPWRWLDRLQGPLQRAHRRLLDALQAWHLPRLDSAAPARLATRFETQLARWPWVITALALLGLVLGWLA